MSVVVPAGTTVRVTVTDMVWYAETYTERVGTTVTEHVPYTVPKRVAPFTVRVPPLTKTYMAMKPYTYTVRVRYCVTWDVVVGQSVCTKYGYRNEHRTGMRETLITEPAYHYENRPACNYRDEQKCCKPVTRTVTATRTVRETQSAVPSASCTAAGYSLNSSSRCERAAGIRLGAVSRSCAGGWTAVSGDSGTCERTLTRVPTWTCAAGHSVDRATTPPHCHPDEEDDDEEGTEEEEEGTEEEEEEEEDEGDENDPECTTALSTLGSGTVTRNGSWATGCESVHKSTDQVPYYAWRFTFTVTGTATLDLDAVSAGDPHVYITDSDGTVVGSDDDSGSDGRDSRIRGLRLVAGTYTIEVTTGSDRLTGSFTLTLKLTTVAAETVQISGFAPAEETPALGKTAVVVASGFAVSPAGAKCSVKPGAASVSPASGASRTVSLRVAAAATVTVTVTCTSGTDSDMASAKFKANPAPVRISGFSSVSVPAGDGDSVVVTEDFDVTPADAKCTVTPAAASVSPTTGGTRTVSLEVDKGVTASVTLTCSKDGASHRVHAKFAATRFDGCMSSLGKFGSGGVTVRAAISSAGGCKSVRRHDETGRTSYARWHTLKLASPGWVTVTLRSAASNDDPLDVYLLILQGAAANGSGKRLAFNDDHRSELTFGKRDSLIARYFLAAGTYTIEATTYGWLEWHEQHDVEGDYVLHVNVDHTPAASQPTSLRVENGTTATSTWSYQPASTATKLASSFPDGLTASLDASGGRAKLAVTPSEVGQYAVLVTYSNGPETLTKSTTVTSYCPTGQTALPSGCGTELKPLGKGADVFVRNPPHGYAPDSACHESELTESQTYLWCRRIRDTRTYILRSDPKIIETGDRIVTKNGDFGRILMIKPGGSSDGGPLEALEGCQPITSEHWQCDYYSDQMFQTVLEHGSFFDYALPALRKGVLDPVGKLSVCAGFFLRARLTPSPQASAAAIGACTAAVVPPKS